MTKKEVVVLFDLLNIADIPCSVGNMPTVSQQEYTKITAAFYKNKAVVHNGKNIKLDKGLEEYILPISSSKQILLSNYGEDKQCKINTSVYFSKNSVIAVSEKKSEYIEFLKINSLKELLLLLPAVDEAPQNIESYFSFILLKETSAAIYVAIVDIKTDSVTVTETTRQFGQTANEQKKTITVSKFSEDYKKRLEEIYNVFDS